MSMTRISGLAFLGITLVLAVSNADAQHRRSGRHGYTYGSGQHNSGYRNSGKHFIRNTHGEVIGRYHRDTIPHGSNYIVPHSGTDHHGSYYTRNGNYYYYPQTVSTSGGHHGTQYQPQQIRFGGFSQVDDLAGRLETMANDFCLDLHYNYSHNKNFQEVYREAYEILETAKYIHTAKHQQDHKAVQERLGGLDKLAHHVQEEVTPWSRHHQRQVGQLGLLSKMSQIQSTIHHMMNDVGVKPTAVDKGHH